MHTVKIIWHVNSDGFGVFMLLEKLSEVVQKYK